MFSQVINFLESLSSLGLVSQDDLDLADSVAPVGVIDNNADVALRLKNHNFIYTVVTKAVQSVQLQDGILWCRGEHLPPRYAKLTLYVPIKLIHLICGIGVIVTVGSTDLI